MSDAKYYAKKGKLVELKIEVGDDPNIAKQALYIALLKEQVECVKFLLEFDFEPTNNHVCTACRSGNIDCVKLFLDHPDLAKGLVEAAEQGHLEIVKFLVENGVDFNCENAVEFAAKKHQLETVNWMLKNGATGDFREAIILNAALGETDMLKLLLNHEVPEDAALADAIKYRRVEAAAVLLEDGRCDPLVGLRAADCEMMFLLVTPYLDKPFSNAMQIAAESSFFECVVWLLDAETNALDTCVRIAAKKEYGDVLICLLKLRINGRGF